jgi:hypothetical protein
MFGNLADALRNSVAMHGLERDDFENQHVERTLQQVGFFYRHFSLLDNRHTRAYM